MSCVIKQILPQSAVRKLATPYVDTPGGNPAEHPRYPYGLNVRDCRGVRVLQHGDAGESQSDVSRAPKRLQPRISRPDLKSFTVRTLIIHGAENETLPIDASGRAAAQGITDSKLIEYDGAPHGLFATHKERLTADLLKFSRQK